MSILVQIIEKCLSSDNIIRSNAEQELLKCCDQNLFEILSKFSNFIADDSTPINIRQFCGTFIKHIFSNETYVSIWYNFSAEQNNLIKNNILGSLASEKDDTKRTCSMAICWCLQIISNKLWAPVSRWGVLRILNICHFTWPQWFHDYSISDTHQWMEGCLK